MGAKLFEVEAGTPMARAHLALRGLAIGDAVGGFFEFSQGRLSQWVAQRKLPSGIWHWTDDTQMALSVFAVLRQCGQLQPDLFAASLAQRYEQARGYGLTTRAILQRMRKSKTWQAYAGAVFRGQGSWGNGAASRVPPLGAFFADNLPEAARQAQLSALVTHAHPEAVAGAVSVAVATATAWQLRLEKNVSRQQFLEQVLAWVPESRVRDQLIMARNLSSDTTVQAAVAVLGNGQRATAQTTVPFALWCAADLGQTYADAIWLALEGQGDCDTIGAIVGGITAMRVGAAGLPAAWQQSCEPLPPWAFVEDIAAF